MMDTQKNAAGVRPDDLLVPSALLRALVAQQIPVLRPVYQQASDVCADAVGALAVLQDRVDALGATVVSQRKKLGRYAVARQRLRPLIDQLTYTLEAMSQSRVDGDYAAVDRQAAAVDELQEHIRALLLPVEAPVAPADNSVGENEPAAPSPKVARKSVYDCPQCGKRGHRRHGVHFDHEWRCGTCAISWDPDTAVLSMPTLPVSPTVPVEPAAPLSHSEKQDRVRQLLTAYGVAVSDGDRTGSPSQDDAAARRLDAITAEMLALIAPDEQPLTETITDAAD